MNEIYIHSFHFIIKRLKEQKLWSCKSKKDRRYKDLKLYTYNTIIKSTSTHSNININIVTNDVKECKQVDILFSAHNVFFCFFFWVSRFHWEDIFNLTMLCPIHLLFITNKIQLWKVWRHQRGHNLRNSLH